MFGKRGDIYVFSAHCVCWCGWSSAVLHWRWLNRQLGEKDENICISSSVFSSWVELWECSYFGGLPHDVGTEDPGATYDFCSVEDDAVFSLCGVFSFCWSLVLQSGIFNVLKNPGWNVTACLLIYILAHSPWRL